MNALWAVYKREVAVYFRSFIAYAIGFALLGFLGLLFMGNVAFVQQQQLSPQGGVGATATDLVGVNLGVVTFLLFLIAPLLTMRLLSEETREGTMEVLLTLPMGEWAFVIAKFLAAWTYYTFLLALTLVHLALLASAGPVNTGLVFSMYLGAFLYGGAALAISMIWSAVTEDQLVAAFLGAATVLAFALADQLAIIVNDQALIAGASEFVRQLGFGSHFNATLLQGLVRVQDILYFIFMIVIPLFITTLIVGSKRWRAS